MKWSGCAGESWSMLAFFPQALRLLQIMASLKIKINYCYNMLEQ